MIPGNDSERRRLPTQVLVANLSGVMLEIVVRAIQQQPDMILTSYTKDLVELREAVGNQTDVLIIGAPYVYPVPTICRDLWRSFPALKVLVITPSGDAAVMYWLSVQRHRLKMVSTKTLIDTIQRVPRLEFTDE